MRQPRLLPAPPAPVKAFNPLDAIRDFYGLMDASEWTAARELLALIRQSGNAPRYFDIDTMEKRVLDAADAAEAEREYDIIRLMAKREQPAIVQAALRVFWETYPNYDPDHIAISESPSSTPTESLPPSISAAVESSIAVAPDEVLYSVVSGSNYGVSLPLALAEKIASYIGTSTNAEAVMSRFAAGAVGVVVEKLDHINASQLVAQLGEVGNLAWVAQSNGGYSLSITDVGPKKINMIKAVRKVLALGLKEAKDLVESGPPILVASNLPHDEAVRLGRFFTDENARIQITQ